MNDWICQQCGAVMIMEPFFGGWRLSCPRRNDGRHHAVTVAATASTPTAKWPK